MAKKLSIKDQNEKVDILKLDDDSEELVEDLNNDTLEERAKVIRQGAEELDEILEKMSDEEKEIFLEETALKLGVEPEQLKVGPTDNMSDIIKDLSVFVIDQQVKSMNIIYPLSDLVSVRQVENGTTYFNYTDYTDSDETRGDTDVVIADYNQGRNKLTGEIFYCTKHIHKGYDILDTMLNDVAKTTSLFIMLLRDLQKNIALPIAKRIYQYRLQCIADPFGELSANGIDVSEIKADKTITGTDLKSALENLSSWYATLQYPSREHTPNEKWIPNKFEKDIEINPVSPTILAPQEFEKDIKFNVNAGTFQLSEINGLTEKMRYIDFNKTFVEYGKVSGLKFDRETQTYNLFVMTSDNPVEIIQHYNGTKVVDTPKLKSVVHQYTRLGKAINKLGRIWKIELKVEKPAE